MRRFWKNESGMTAAFFAILLLVFVAMLGIVVDGGYMILSKRQLTSAADAAILSVVKSYDVEKWENENIVILEENYARSLAQQYLEENMPDAYIASFQILPDRKNTAVMTAKVKVEFIFMRIFKLESKEIQAKVSCVVG